MSSSDTIAILVCSLGLILLLWKEGTRKNKRFLWLRMAAALAAAGSLLLLKIPFTFTKTVSSSDTKKAIILTEGFREDSLHSFLSAAKDSIPVFTFDKHLAAAVTLPVTYLPDASLLSTYNKNIHSFEVFGYGFSQSELQRWKEQSFRFHPATLPSGVTDIHWKPVLRSGEKQIVEGVYHHTSSSPVKLALSRYGKTVDSVWIKEKGKQPFVLSAVPKALGKAGYQMFVSDGNDTLEREIIPFQVKTFGKPRILILASSPDFDNKFLKNSLASQQVSVAVRTTISKNKYSSDYANGTDISLKQIDAATLHHFDVVIADATALAALTESEAKALQTKVAEDGLGLVVKYDSSANSFVSPLFSFSQTALTNGADVQMISANTGESFPALPVSRSAIIQQANHLQPLIRDKQQNMYADCALYGRGKIVLLTITNTYIWALASEEAAYNRFWTTLLDAALAKPSANENWSVSPFLPRVNEPAEILLQTLSGGLPQGNVNGIPVYLKQRADLPFCWSGTYYPERTGWQTIIELSGEPSYWYAFGEFDWQNVRRSQKMFATNEFISTNSYGRKQTIANETIRQTAVPPFYFFVLFLIGSGFLWWENKRGANSG